MTGALNTVTYTYRLVVAKLLPVNLALAFVSIVLKRRHSDRGRGYGVLVDKASKSGANDEVRREFNDLTPSSRGDGVL